MPVRFLGLCAPHVGYEFRIESLILGPFAVDDLTQHTDPTYCEAATAAMEFQGQWVGVEDASDLSNVVAYDVTITVPEPSLSISLAVGALLLWWLA